MEPDHPRFNDLRAGRVNAQQRLSEKDTGISENKSCQNRTELSAQKDPPYALVLSTAHILARKRNGRLMESIHGDINKTFDIRRRRISRNDRRSENIDR